MSDDGKFTLQEMFTLENLITTERDDFELRYSSTDDLQPLETTQVGNYIKAEITEWRFITLEDKRKGGGPLVFLTGMRSERIATMTSDVIGYNMERQLVFTQSGSVYRLDGDRADIPLDMLRIAAIAATMNGWGIGGALGMPLAFF